MGRGSKLKEGARARKGNEARLDHVSQTRLVLSLFPGLLIVSRSSRFRPPCYRRPRWRYGLRSERRMSSAWPIYVSLAVPTFAAPSANCLQWTADGQLVLVTKTAVHVLVRPLRPLSPSRSVLMEAHGGGGRRRMWASHLICLARPRARFHSKAPTRRRSRHAPSASSRPCSNLRARLCTYGRS
jgi:hypothetical protein